MLKRMAFLLTAVLFLATVVTNAAAQQTDDVETVAAGSSQLTAITLPPGARRIKEASVPEEIKSILAKVIAAGGENIRQGGSEVFVWGGNYKKAGGARMIKNLETALKNSGWQYEIGDKANEFAIFTLFRTEPSRRGLIGFFVPSEEVFVFAVAEMLRADAASVETETPAAETSAAKPARTGGETSIYGKWLRSKGGGFVDYTGKTNYKSGENFYFEFFPDGTVEYTREQDVLSIMQCKINGKDTARGKFSVSGNTLTIKLGAGKSVETNSCNSGENFNKTLEPATISVQFQIRKSDSVLRPDNPTMMCFDGKDDVCYEKIGK